MHWLESDKRRDEEFLGEKFFDQEICSPHCDVDLHYRRRGRSVSALNAAQDARRRALRSRWFKGERK
jgi:hypothetical protein